MNTDHRHLETEVKFFLDDPAPVRRRILGSGARRLGKAFETNIRYDDGSERLARKGQLLRLRRDDACRLTFKSPPAETDDQVKIYKEFEVAVSDADTMNAILKALGFKAVQIYEKWRETFALDDGEICIDTMPYGCFAEIEAPRAAIRPMAEKLGFSWADRILTNYLAMFETLRQKAGLAFNDLTFDNFARQPADIRQVLGRFAVPDP